MSFDRNRLRTRLARAYPRLSAFQRPEHEPLDNIQVPVPPSLDSLPLALACRSPLEMLPLKSRGPGIPRRPQE